MRVHQRRLHQRQRHRLARLPARAGDGHGAARRVIALVGADGGEAVVFGRGEQVAAGIGAAGRHQQPRVGSGGRAVIERRGGGSGTCHGERAGGRLAVGPASIGSHGGGEQLGRSQRRTAGGAPEQQHGAVVRQPDGLMALPRRHQRHRLPGCRGRRRKAVRRRIVELERGQLALAVAAAGRQHAAVEEPRQRERRARRLHRRTGADGSAGRIVELARGQHGAAGVGASGDQHAAVVELLGRSAGPRRRQRAQQDEAAGGRIVGLQRVAHRAVAASAGHQHAAVKQRDRGGIGARLEHATRHRRPGVRRRIVELGGVGDAAAGGDAAGHQYAAIAQPCGHEMAPRHLHRCCRRNASVGPDDLDRRHRPAGVAAADHQHAPVGQQHRGRTAARPAERCARHPAPDRRLRQTATQSARRQQHHGDQQALDPPSRSACVLHRTLPPRSVGFSRAATGASRHEGARRKKRSPDAPRDWAQNYHRSPGGINGTTVL